MLSHNINALQNNLCRYFKYLNYPVATVQFVHIFNEQAATMVYTHERLSWILCETEIKKNTNTFEKKGSTQAYFFYECKNTKPKFCETNWIILVWILINGFVSITVTNRQCSDRPNKGMFYCGNERKNHRKVFHFGEEILSIVYISLLFDLIISIFM